MKNRRDLNHVRPDAIHDSVVAVDHLTKRFVTDLRDDASGQRIPLQTLDRGNKALNQEVGGARRVACYIGPYGLYVFDGQR